jgi:hypothetical protein
MGAVVDTYAFVVELTSLKGRAALGQADVFALVQY